MRSVSKARVLEVSSAIGILMLAGGIVAGAAFWLGEQGVESPTGTTVALDPPANRLVCPGPLLLPEALDTDQAYNPVPAQAENLWQAALIPADPVAGAQSAGWLAWQELNQDVTGWQALLEDSSADPSAVSGGLWVAQSRAEHGVLVQQAGEEAAANALLSAAHVSWVPAGDLTGLAALHCQTPGFERWFSGISTTVGNTGQLVIQNPGLSPISVELSAWGAVGEREVEGQRVISVPPLSSTVTLVEGLVSGERRVALKLSASGGPFTAYLQTSELRGLTPAGMDLLAASARAETTQYLTALKVRDSELTEADPAVLFLLNPSAQEASVSVRLFSANGELEDTDLANLSVAGNSISEVSLAGLPEGVYTAEVTSNQPLVATARLSMPATLQHPRDFAWASATPLVPAEVTSHLVLPDAARGTVTIFAPASQAGMVSVRYFDRGGALLHTQELELLADTGAELDLAVLDAQLENGVAGVGSFSVSGDVDLIWGAALEAPGWASANPNAISVLQPHLPVASASEITVTRQGGVG